MNREKVYQDTLLHVIKWLGGNGFDMWKPVEAHFANQIREICIYVVNGDSLEEAIRKVKSQ